jgi:hypothetical protein
MVVNLAIYIFKVNLVLTVFYLLYYGLLSRLTFHIANRIFLNLIVLLSFLLPLLNLDTLLSSTSLPIHNVAKTVDAFRVYVVRNYADANASTGMPPLLCLVLTLGFAFFLFRLAYSLFSLLRMCGRSTYAFCTGGYGVYYVDRDIPPFSFFKRVYLHPNLHNEHERNQIIAHEVIHIRQWHSIDILLSEMVLIFSWFNPVGWFYKRAVRLTLEYIVDREIIEQGADRECYQLCLLSVFSQKRFLPAPYFRTSSLKKRMLMINRGGESGDINLLRYIAGLPCVLLVCLALNNRALTAPFTARLRQASTILEHLTQQRPTPGIQSKASPVAGIKKVKRNKQEPNSELNKAGGSVPSIPETETIEDDIPKGNHWQAKMTDDIEVTISQPKIFVDGKEGIAEIKNREQYPQEINIKNFPQAVFMDHGVALPLSEYQNKIPIEKIRKTTIYLGKYAINEFGELGKNGVVVFELNS